MDNKKLKEMLTIVLDYELTGVTEEELVKILQNNYTKEEIRFVINYLKEVLTKIEK